MTRRLSVSILLSVLCYLLFPGPSFAQEITPPITSSPQIKLQAQGNAWENFKNMFIPDTLKQANNANLPFAVGTNIGAGITGPAIKPQANNQPDNKDTVANAAGQYTIASGIHTPPEISHASTNIIQDFFASIANAISGIFDRGEKEAKNSVTILPQEVKDQVFTQTAVTPGQDNTAMGKALPLNQCGVLPAGLCGSDNKPNFVNNL